MRNDPFEGWPEGVKDDFIRAYGGFDEEAEDAVHERSLRKRFGKDVKIVGSWDNPKTIRQIDPSELLPGELSAVVLEIGGYTVRNAQRAFKGDDYTTQEYITNIGELETIKKKERNIGSCYGRPITQGTHRVWVKNEISAIRTVDSLNSFTDGYKMICQAAHCTSWSENINYIGVVLPSSSSPGEDEVLCVGHFWIGSSGSSQTWYKLASNGVVGRESE